MKKRFFLYLSTTIISICYFSVIQAFPDTDTIFQTDTSNNIKIIVRENPAFITDTNDLGQVLIKDSPIMANLDSLAHVKYFKNQHFPTDSQNLNTYQFAPGQIPQYDDSIYRQRINDLNAETPIELIFNKQVKNFILLYANKKRELTSKILGLSEIYFPLFGEQLDKYDLPLELKYLAVVESALNPTAGSRAGAKGLWQFMYYTGKV